MLQARSAAGTLASASAIVEKLPFELWVIVEDALIDLGFSAAYRNHFGTIASLEGRAEYCPCAEQCSFVSGGVNTSTLASAKGPCRSVLIDFWFDGELGYTGNYSKVLHQLSSLRSCSQAVVSFLAEHHMSLGSCVAQSRWWFDPPYDPRRTIIGVTSPSDPVPAAEALDVQGEHVDGDGTIYSVQATRHVRPQGLRSPSINAALQRFARLYRFQFDCPDVVGSKRSREDPGIFLASFALDYWSARTEPPLLTPCSF